MWVLYLKFYCCLNDFQDLFKNTEFWPWEIVNFFRKPVFPSDWCLLDVDFRIFVVGVTTAEILNRAQNSIFWSILVIPAPNGRKISLVIITTFCVGWKWCDNSFWTVLLLTMTLSYRLYFGGKEGSNPDFRYFRCGYKSGNKYCNVQFPSFFFW